MALFYSIFVEVVMLFYMDVVKRIRFIVKGTNYGVNHVADAPSLI